MNPYAQIAGGALALIAGVVLLLARIDEPEITYLCFIGGLGVLVGPQALRALTARRSAGGTKRKFVLAALIPLPLALAGCFLFSKTTIEKEWVDAEQQGYKADEARLRFFQDIIPKTQYAKDPKTVATLRAWEQDVKARAMQIDQAQGGGR